MGLVMKQGFRLILVLLGTLLFLGASDTRNEHLITVTDFQSISRQMQDNDLVLMLEFSSDYCPYCIRLEEDYLKPMLRSTQYDDKVLIRRIDLGGYTKVVNFDGQLMSPSKFAAQYDAYLTPTLIFVNHRGEELAEQLVGLGTEGFFSAYIDQHIEQARSKLLKSG